MDYAAVADRAQGQSGFSLSSKAFDCARHSTRAMILVQRPRR